MHCGPYKNIIDALIGNTAVKLLRFAIVMLQLQISSTTLNQIITFLILIDLILMIYFTVYCHAYIVKRTNCSVHRNYRYQSLAGAIIKGMSKMAAMGFLHSSND